ncbi:MAG: PAS domain S-box protein [Paludibacter sp.]|nr:PAS domain S-box protein [Paludibacter sp.]
MESKKIKVLAIDDNLDNLITIQALVYESFPNAEIVTALNGKDGLKLAGKEDPDVILLDIVMPEMDGFEVCKLLKEDQYLCDIPVVFVTALKGDKESRIRGLDVGAEAFLAKPIDESELVAQIRAMVKIKAGNIQRRNENEKLAALVAERTHELKRTHTATLNLLEDLKNEIEARKRTEEALRESEEKYRDMANLLPQIVFELDLNGNINYINNQAFTIYRYPETSNLIGINSIDFFIPEDRLRAVENVKLRLADKPTENNVYSMIRKDGTTFPVQVYSNPILKDNKPIGLRGIIVDITEQKLAAEKIEHVARLYAFLSQINQAIVRTQDKIELYEMICQVAIEHGHFRMAWVGILDESTEKIRPIAQAGYDDGYLNQIVVTSGFQINGKGPSGTAYREGKIIFSNDVATDPNMQPWKDEALKRGYKSSIAVPFRRKDEVIGVLTLYATETGFFSEDELILLDEVGSDISFAINAIDSENQRQKANEELETSRNELKTIYDYAPVMMCLVDVNRNIQFANKAFIALANVSENDIIGGPVGGVIGCINSFDNPLGCGHGAKCATCTLRMAMDNTFKTGFGHQNVEFQSTLKVGYKELEVSLLGSTAIIENDENRNLLLCLNDITDRKLTEEALQKSEMILRTFIDNTPFEIWASDVENVGMLENRKLVNRFGTIIGKTPMSNSRVSKEFSDLWVSLNQRVVNGELIDEEYECIINDTKRIYQHIAFPITISSKTIGVAGFNIDITDRKLVEEALKENNTRLELAMEVSNMAWWEMEVQTGNVSFGKRKTEMIGYPAENFKHYTDFMELVHADDYDRAMNAMRTHLHNSNKKYETEYRILASTGEYKWFYDIGTVSRKDSNGKPLTISGLILDITQRKMAEQELADQKNFFEQMFMQSSLSTQILDKEGWCERINPKLSQIFGVEANQMEGHVYNIFNDKEIQKKGIIPKLEKVFNKGKTVEWEVLFDIGEAADSQNIELNERKKAWFSNWAYPIFDQNGSISSVIIQHTDITDRKIAEAALSESQDQLKKFAAHLQSIREEERVLLAREIHDELGQILIAIKIDMGMLKQNVLRGINEEISENILTKFDGLFSMVDNTIKTTRKIMTDLRPEVLDLLGFTETVKQHLNAFQERYNIECKFESNIYDVELDSQQSVALFRIIQEALNNVAKHSKATKVDVIFNQSVDKLMLEVIDNGIGFDLKQKKNADSYGLIGMNERVFLLEGELTISGKKGVGTSVRIIMPYTK